MKHELMVVVVSFFVTLGFAFFVFNFQGGITGNIVQNVSLEKGVNESNGNSSLDEIEVTKEDVLEGIKNSEEIILEMLENNFSIVYVNDTLVDARRVFDQVKFAEILRDKNSHYKDRSEARTTLRLIDWENLTYSDVIVYIEEIQDRRNEAFLLYDSFGVAEIDLKGYLERGVNITEAEYLLDRSKEAFYEDRYDDSRDLLEVAKANLRVKSLGRSTFRVLSQGAKNLVQKYWERYWHVIIAVAVQISIISFFLYRGIYKKVLEKRIRKLSFKKKSLLNLLKETQKERYKRRKISEVVYNIRMKKYQEELGKIREQLPVLEEKLNKLIIQKDYLKK
jgi:hypothetical protein